MVSFGARWFGLQGVIVFRLRRSREPLRYRAGMSPSFLMFDWPGAHSGESGILRDHRRASGVRGIPFRLTQIGLRGVSVISHSSSALGIAFCRRFQRIALDLWQVCGAPPRDHGPGGSRYVILIFILISFLLEFLMHYPPSLSRPQPHPSLAGFTWYSTADC